MVLETGTWDEDLDWLTKKLQMDPAPESTQANETTPSSSNKQNEEEGVDGKSFDYYQQDFEDDADADYELDQLRTDEEKAILEANTHRNNDALDYSVLDKLQKANEDLAKDPVVEEGEDRERKVLFKNDLVEFKEASDNESSSSSSEDEEEFERKAGEYYKEVTSDDTVASSSSSPASPSDDTVEINGQRVRKSEKVLIERDGKFELVELGELEAILPPLNGNKPAKPPIAVVNGDAIAHPPAAGDSSSLHSQGLPPCDGSEGKSPRPKSAPTAVNKPHPPSKPPRPKSAFNTNERRPPRKNRPFAYSPEMKEIIKKRMAAKAEREREEEARKKAEKEAARKEAHEAWQAWRERKDAELRENKKKLKELEEEAKRKEKDPKDGEEAYKNWMKMKYELSRDQRLTYEQYQLEQERRYQIRNRERCESAYKSWVRRKNRETRLKREEDEILRKEMMKMQKKMKKTRKLLDAIRDAQEMKYIDYYQ